MMLLLMFDAKFNMNYAICSIKSYCWLFLFNFQLIVETKKWHRFTKEKNIMLQVGD